MTAVPSATLTPEARGLARDEVRLAVVTPAGTEHTCVRELSRWLEPGDLLVVNTSATLPSAVDTAYGAVHVSTELDDGAWVVELRRSDGHGHRVPGPGEVVVLPGGVRLRIDRPLPDGQSRLWRATTLPRVGRVAYLTGHGRPIRYSYLERPVPLEDLQNVYAGSPGSAEMPSAGRPLTRELLVDLMSAGVVVAPLVLHTGVASQESYEPPQPEWFSVPAHTARLVKLTKQTGSRVVAVGTTVVRALETAADGRTEGWTSLVLSPDRRARVVDGLVTGLHEPQASHFQLLEAVAGRSLVDRGYADITAADAPSYLWHELGDSMLLLP
jgi:S-adenosylmethionine:tRNA ribosyltransferase-isomerase